MRHAPALLLLLTFPATARADAEEATLTVDGGPVLIRTQAPAHSTERATRPGGHAGVRLAYGLTDTFTIDLAVAGSLAEGVEYRDQELADPPPSVTRATIHHNHRAVRALAGVTARLGVRIIPTVSLGVGYQHRFTTGGVLLEEGRSPPIMVDSVPDTQNAELLVAAGVGLDLRLGRRLALGVSAQVTHAFALSGGGFDALEIPVRLTYHWYPGWFRRRGIERLDDEGEGP